MPKARVAYNNNYVNVKNNNDNVKVTLNEEIVNVLLGSSGPQGAAGRTILSGSGQPSSEIGVNGDFYIDTLATTIYGPKTNGDWGNPTSLIVDPNLGYIHDQSSSSDTWTIVHGLGFTPNITVVDSAGSVIEGSYSYSSDGNTVTATFNGATTGKAYLS
jgi:hypothetical protein